MSGPATLPIEGATRCGYCGTRLVLWTADDWRCPDCAPEVARIQTAEEWVMWARRKHREARR